MSLHRADGQLDCVVLFVLSRASVLRRVAYRW